MIDLYGELCTPHGIITRETLNTCNSITKYFEQLLKTLLANTYSFRFDYTVDVFRDGVDSFKVRIRIYNITSGCVYEPFKDMLSRTLKEASASLIQNMDSHFPSSIRLFSIVLEICSPVKGMQVYPLVSITKNKEENDMANCIPEVKEIIHRTGKKGETFSVVWADGTKTTIKKMEGDMSDDYVAFMYCVSIKMFGSKGDCRQYIKEKKQVFEDRVERRSKEIKAMRAKRRLEEQARSEVPYAQGLRLPALASSDLFKKNKRGDI